MNKTKEEILKEFGDLKFENKQHFGRNADSEMIFEKVFEPLLAKVEAQTREETIREVEEMIKKEFPHQKLYCEAQNLRCEILEELNKLKK